MKVTTMKEELAALLELSRRLEDEHHRLHSQSYKDRDSSWYQEFIDRLDGYQSELEVAQTAFLKRWSKP